MVPNGLARGKGKGYRVYVKLEAVPMFDMMCWHGDVLGWELRGGGGGVTCELGACRRQ